MTGNLHVHVPVEAEANGSPGDVGSEGGDAGNEHGAGFLPAEPASHSLCPAYHLIFVCVNARVWVIVLP